MKLAYFRTHLFTAASLVVVALVAILPMLAGAQADPQLGYFDSLFIQISDLVTNILIPLVLALALLLFIWGVIQYFILGAGDEGKRETGRAYMLYAIIGLVAIVAVWGLVNLVLQILGVGVAGPPPPPGIPGTN